MAMPSWAPVLGAGLADAFNGYSKAMLELPKLRDEQEELAQRKQLRPLELELTQAKIAEARHRAELQPRISAKEAELVLMRRLSASDNPQDQEIYRTWLGRLGAPAAQAQASQQRAGTSAQVAKTNDIFKQSLVQRYKALHEEAQERAKIASERNSILRERFQNQATRTTAEYNTIMAMYALSKSENPEEQQIAEDFFARKNVPVQREQREQELQPGRLEKQQDTIELAEQMIQRRRTENQYLEPGLEARLAKLKEQLRQLALRGESLPDKLEAELDNIIERTVSSQQRRAESAALQPTKLAIAQQRLEQLKARNKTLPDKLQAELELLQERANQAQLKGEQWPEELDVRLEKLHAEVEGLRGREQRADEREPDILTKNRLAIDLSLAHLKKLKVENQFLPPRRQLEFDRLTEQLEQLREKGQSMSPYLEARLRKLEQDITVSQGRERRAESLQPTKEQKAVVDLESAQERLAQFQAKGPFIAPRLQLDIARLQEQLKQQQVRGETLSPYLKKKLEELEQRVVRGQPARDKSSLRIENSPFGKKTTKTYSGIGYEVELKAYQEGMTALPSQAKDVGAKAVSGKVPGPIRDGWARAYRDTYGEDFQPVKGVIPQAPVASQAGNQNRPLTATEQEQLRKDFFNPNTLPSAPSSMQPRAFEQNPLWGHLRGLTNLLDPREPMAGGREHRALQAYRANLLDADEGKAREAWQVIKQSGDQFSIRAFQRAFAEKFQKAVE